MSTTATGTAVGAVLFTDLVGFTEYTGVVGDESALTALDAQTDIVGAAIEGCDEARIVKELGDGVMVWFVSADDALRCATALLADVESARARGEFPLPMRLGLHFGAALQRGDDLVGQTVNIAARVCELAGPGELLVSEHLVDAVNGACLPPGVRPIGPARVKGIDEPIWVHRVSA
jgi:class 3 adenylate cyclase